GRLAKITLEDKYGPLNIHLLPFIKPAQVRPFFAENIASYDEALRAVLNSAEIKPKERNVLLAHQFITDGGLEPERSESEIISVGGLDSIDVSAFTDFDYVALGHLHRPQSVGRDGVRYSGSPLKYSFSESLHEKSVTIVEMGPKGEIDLRERALTPKKDLREIKGPLQELLAVGRLDETGSQDYLRIVLTDEAELYDPLGQLRQVYPNLMALDFARIGRAEAEIAGVGEVSERSPLDLFAEFYQLQQDDDLSEEQIRLLEEIFDKAGDLV
ncbi:MAG TPA: exonuclease sbcCD subunit D, partial [Firmicutes bacterium]|nr:exonuclease sbcCD subunit D [Bacillota bacterium]